MSREIPRLMTSECVFLEMGMFALRIPKMFNSICSESLLIVNLPFKVA